MTKRILTVFTLFAVLVGTDAYASRARLAVMGSGSGVGTAGSLFYSDAYNMFYNPAYVNDASNWAIVEKSNGVITPSATTAATAEGQAGAVTEMGGMNVGLFFNRGGAGIGDKPLDLLVGGDSGTKWGARFTYDQTDGDNKSADLSVGFEVSDFAPFFSYRVIGKVAGADVRTWEGGLTYSYGDWTPYFVMTNDSNESDWTVGLGRALSLSEGTAMNYAVHYSDGGNLNGTFGLDLNLESDVASWLTVRGGFGYRTASTTSIGGTIHAGNLDVDFAVGNDATNSGQENLAAPTISAGGGLLTMVSASYRW